MCLAPGNIRESVTCDRSLKIEQFTRFMIFLFACAIYANPSESVVPRGTTTDMAPLKWRPFGRNGAPRTDGHPLCRFLPTPLAQHVKLTQNSSNGAVVTMPRSRVHTISNSPSSNNFVTWSLIQVCEMIAYSGRTCIAISSVTPCICQRGI